MEEPVPVIDYDKEQPISVLCKQGALRDASARTDILNRLRRAEGQLRGIQRMVESGEDCMKIGQQFSAVRKALDSSYLRMTLCFVEQELESRALPAVDPKTDVSKLLVNLEGLLARLR